MDLRLKIVVALVAGLYLELLSYEVLLQPWMDLELHALLVRELLDMGLGSVARHFGLIWSRVPEWSLAMIGAIVIGMRVERKQRTTAMMWGLGLIVGGYIGPILEGCSATYGRWAMKFTAAYLVLGLGTLMFAYIGSCLGAWAGNRGD